ncbi:MAG: sugar ABC transporter ATP-binding protein [Acidimicrobiia bacterium]
MTAVASTPSDTRPVVLGARNVFKRYGSIQALQDVSVDIHQGESVALIGANGAGKSTLVRVLTGAVQPDWGEVVINDQTQAVPDVRTARKFGIGYIPQELGVVPDLTVAENVLLAGWPNRSSVVRDRQGKDMAAAACARVGLAVDPDATVATLSPAERRIVMIARSMVAEPSTLILDEPTAALADAEADRLVEVVNDLRAQGLSIVYISHRMGEISQLCDTIVVIRDGKVLVTDVATPESVQNAVAIGIAGSGYEAQAAAIVEVGTTTDEETGVSSAAPVDESAALGFTPEHTPPSASGDIALRVTNLRNRVLNGVSFEVRKGEIVGLAGLLGSGRTEILRAIAGADRISDGTVEAFGQTLRLKSPADALKHGVTLLPEDRRNQGGLLSLSIADNLVLPDIPSRGPLVLRRDEHKRALEAIERFGIKCSGPDAPLASLSGGNQQKVILARWLLLGAQVLLLDEPTAGIDVIAKGELMNLVRQEVRDGRSAVMVSSEMAELCEYCDRIYIVHAGTITGVVGGDVPLPELARLCGERSTVSTTLDDAS